MATASKQHLWQAIIGAALAVLAVGGMVALCVVSADKADSHYSAPASSKQAASEEPKDLRNKMEKLLASSEPEDLKDLLNYWKVKNSWNNQMKFGDVPASLGLLTSTGLLTSMDDGQLDVTTMDAAKAVGNQLQRVFANDRFNRFAKTRCSLDLCGCRTTLSFTLESNLTCASSAGKMLQEIFQNKLCKPHEHLCSRTKESPTGCSPKPCKDHQDRVSYMSQAEIDKAYCPLFVAPGPNPYLNRTAVCACYGKEDGVCKRDYPKPEGDGPGFGFANFLNDAGSSNATGGREIIASPHDTVSWGGQLIGYMQESHGPGPLGKRLWANYPTKLQVYSPTKTYKYAVPVCQWEVCGCTIKTAFSKNFLDFAGKTCNQSTSTEIWEKVFAYSGEEPAPTCEDLVKANAICDFKTLGREFRHTLRPGSIWVDDAPASCGATTDSPCDKPYPDQGVNLAYLLATARSKHDKNQSLVASPLLTMTTGGHAVGFMSNTFNFAMKSTELGSTPDCRVGDGRDMNYQACCVDDDCPETKICCRNLLGGTKCWSSSAYPDRTKDKLQCEL